MAAYLIVDVTRVRDPDAYAQYRERVTPGLERAGGRYLARGGRVDVLEGTWSPGRLVLVEFSSMLEGRRWWDSADYRPLRALRQSSTDGNMVLLDGLAEVQR
ncbi:DUF1330 domain-containing protein [Pendulispora brunnea]|uniref:DUF1330 domain-containing protein n=1 Tax=Pendulispora brunnea TaxID=2905690 RepID=A0ABZ2JYF2_9BACT